MSFTDLLELSLDFSDGVILEVLDLLEGRPNHAEGLRINTRGCKDLVDLGILRLERLLDGLKLTLEHQIAKTSLLVELVDELVERVKQLHLLFLEVLVLLELNFVLPLVFLVLGFEILDLNLALAKLLLNALMLRVFLAQLNDVLISFLEGIDDLSILVLLLDFVLLCVLVFLLFLGEIILQLLDDVQVSVRDLLVVLFDGGVFLGVLARQVLDRLILLGFNLRDLSFAFLFHVLAQEQHLVLEFELDLVGDALVFFTLVGRFLVVVAREGVQVLVVAHVLLLFGHVQPAEILLQLALGDAVLIFSVLKSDLGLFLQLGQLVEVLEDQML